MDGLILDAGCGFDINYCYPNLDADVSVDINLDKSEIEFINMLRNPVICSVEYLSFRKEVFKKIHARAILEHLNDPYRALRDFKYVMVYDAELIVTIPIIVSHFKHFLIILIIQFPFSIWRIIKEMIVMSKMIRIKGYPHLSDIKPEHFINYFRRYEIITFHHGHKWFQSVWGKVIKKFTRGKEVLKDIQGHYEVHLWK